MTPEQVLALLTVIANQQLHISALQAQLTQLAAQLQTETVEAS